MHAHYQRYACSRQKADAHPPSSHLLQLPMLTPPTYASVSYIFWTSTPVFILQDLLQWTALLLLGWLDLEKAGTCHASYAWRFSGYVARMALPLADVETRIFSPVDRKERKASTQQHLCLPTYSHTLAFFLTTRLTFTTKRASASHTSQAFSYSGGVLYLLRAPHSVLLKTHCALYFLPYHFFVLRAQNADMHVL